jgi:RNA polymerase sigma-70 factor (ECF subfamily)
MYRSVEMTASASPQDGNDAPATQWVVRALDRYERPLLAYVHRMVGDVEQSRDIVQEAFLRLLQQDREKVESHLAEWLFTVCRNRALDVRRKRVRSHLEERSGMDEQADQHPGPAESAEADDAAERAAKLVEYLPANQREVLRLRFEHGFSYQQISRIAHLSVSNVGFLIHTGLKALRKRMESADAAAGQET